MSHQIKESSGNLYADLEYSDAQEMNAKGSLAFEICRVIRKKGLSQAQAAKLLDLKQPDLSKLMRGLVRGFSTDRLLRFLQKLGRDIDINIKPSRKKSGKLSVHTSTISSPVPMVAKGRNS